MKIKTLQPTFKRKGFDWELIERKEVLVPIGNSACTQKKFGLYKQDAAHFVVCQIIDGEPHPRDTSGFDIIERIPSDNTWGILAKTYDTLEEAKKEYERK